MKPKTIEAYIEAMPALAQARLLEMLACLRDVATGAEEAIKWSMPALSYNTILFTFAAHKNHLGFYPTPQVIVAFADELRAYKTSKGAIQFPLDKPLPVELIRRIAQERIRRLRENGEKWMGQSKA